MIERIEWWPSGWNGTRGHETGNRPAYSIRLRRELPPATVSQSSAVVVAVVVHRKRKERSDDDYGLRWESLNRHPLSSPAIVHRKRKERSDDPPSPKRFRLRLRASAFAQALPPSPQGFGGQDGGQDGVARDYARPAFALRATAWRAITDDDYHRGRSPPVSPQGVRRACRRAVCPTPDTFFPTRLWRRQESPFSKPAILHA